MTLFYRPLILFLLLLLNGSTVAASQSTRPIKVAILEFGKTETGKSASETITRVFAAHSGLLVIEQDESGPAARGIGYAGSLNMTLEDARDLGAAVGCEFYLIGDAQTLRRSSSSQPVYYESYASVFIVSARTGRLLKWERPSFEAASPGEAEKLLIAELRKQAAVYLETIQTAERNESNERELSVTSHVPVIEEVPDEASPKAKGLRLPQPYRRMRPTYPDTAARAEAQATVDVLVDLDVEGEVEKVEVVRWAGFGLDEETVNTIRRMHFRPAMRDGTPLPIRVLLRYNFVSPKKQDGNEQKTEAGKKET